MVTFDAADGGTVASAQRRLLVRACYIETYGGLDAATALLSETGSHVTTRIYPQTYLHAL